MLFTRDFNTIFRQMYNDVMDNTPITNMSQGSTARAMVESIATRFAEVYSDMDEYNKQSYLSTATGPYLDSIGLLHGVTRYQATRAYSGSSNFHFYIDQATGLSVEDLKNIVRGKTTNVDQILIRRGTTVRTASVNETDAVKYVTTEDADLTDSSSTGVYVPVVASSDGVSNNIGPGALIKHNISSYQWELYPIADYIMCKNDNEINTGTSVESDANYRARIMTGRYANRAGNFDAVMNAARSIPGVMDIIYTPYVEGIGTVKLVVVTNHPLADDATLAGVSAAVNSVAPAGSRMIVVTPEYLALTMKIRLIFNPSDINTQDIIIRNVRQVLLDYVNNIPIGGSFIVNEAVQRIMETSDKIRDISPSNFKVRKYMQSRSTLLDGRVYMETNATPLGNNEGVAMLWSNQNSRTNPPEKFIMLAADLTVCR